MSEPLNTAIVAGALPHVAPPAVQMGETYGMGRMDSKKYKGCYFLSLQKVDRISLYNHQ